MHSIESAISPLVASQFPEFYNEQGPNFIAFVKIYFEWLEQSGNAIHETRKLSEELDIDSTIDEFAAHFKSTFLKGLPYTNKADLAFSLKHILDLYRMKGTIDGDKLLFRLLYNTEANVYRPGDDLLRASAGTWVVPTYIEVEHNDFSRSFLGQTIVGATSGASAVVDSMSSRTVNGKIIDVLYLSSRTGNFQTKEYITANNNLTNAPKILGSLTSLTIKDGGFLISNGDLFDVNSENGKFGVARVSSTINGTGQVDFELISGGSGYNSNTTTVSISDVVLFHGGNTYNTNTSITNMSDTENVTQTTYTLRTVNNSISNASFVTAYDGSNTAIGNGVIYFSNSTQMKVGLYLGTFSNSVIVSSTSQNSFVTVTNTTISNAQSMAVNSIAIGIVNATNTFVSGSYFRGLTTNTVAICTKVSSGNGATFAIGEISNTEIVANSSIGTILNLNSINPGKDYDTPPFVRVTNPAISANLKYDFLLGIANSTGTFAVNQSVKTASGTGGTIRAIPNTNFLQISRQYFADTISANQQIVSYFANGFVSGTANIISSANDTSYPVMGNNCIVSTNATSFAGVVSNTSILNSGLGYIDNELVTLTSQTNNQITFTAITNVQKQGKSLGFWKDNSGKLNSDKFLSDNDYYQVHSYEIQTDISIDRYVDIMKALFHLAGTKLFGKVVRSTEYQIRLSSPGTQITQS